jgi:hypothetical protein
MCTDLLPITRHACLSSTYFNPLTLSSLPGSLFFLPSRATRRRLVSPVKIIVATASSTLVIGSDFNLQHRADISLREGVCAASIMPRTRCHPPAATGEDVPSPTQTEQSPALRTNFDAMIAKVTPESKKPICGMPLCGAKDDSLFDAAMRADSETTTNLLPRRQHQCQYEEVFGRPNSDFSIPGSRPDQFGQHGQSSHSPLPSLQGVDVSIEPTPIEALTHGATTYGEDEVQFLLDALLPDEKPIVYLGQGRNLYDTPGNAAYREVVRANCEAYKDAERSSELKLDIPLSIIFQFRFAGNILGQWQEISNEKALLKKVQQDLRHSESM